jgi:hypothetical protein
MAAGVACARPRPRRRAVRGRRHVLLGNDGKVAS